MADSENYSAIFLFLLCLYFELLKKNPLKLFPHILSRVAGIPFEELEELSFREMEFVNTLLQAEIVRIEEFQNILNSFPAIAQNTNDYRFRAVLSNARKDFQSHRFSFLKKIKRKSPENALKDVNVLLERIEKYQNLIFLFEENKKAFEELYEKERLRHLSILKNQSAHPHFQKSILHSSRSLYHRIGSFQKKDVIDFRKKEMQTARSIVQYFYRAAAKTSPFSYFTTLDNLKLQNDIFKNKNDSNSASLVQTNNLLLAKSKELLLQNPSFYHQLKIKLNPSIQLEDESFLFIKNEKNIEVFQRLENSDFLMWIYNKIHTGSILFGKMLEDMMELIDEEKDVLEDYLLQILETGLVEWDWEISSMQSNWEEKFHKFLLETKDFEKKILWIDLLEKLITHKKRYLTADARTREYLQNSIKVCLDRLDFENVNLELIFFEDVKVHHDYFLEKNEIEPVIKSLDTLLRSLEPLAEDEMKNKIQWFWKTNFEEEERVSFLDFYQQFYETDFSDFNFSNKEKQDLKDTWKIFLKENLRKEEDGTIHFSTSDLVKLNTQINFSNPSKTQYSALLQYFQGEGKTKAVINGLTPGFGKLFGRFLPLFDDDITIDLQNWNRVLQGDDVWIENIDASFFNANLHPPLLDLEMQTPNGQNQLHESQQISFADLEVSWDKEKHAPILVFSKNKKRVTIFDFGFEHPANRSPMFQLLNGFGFLHATYKIFNELINDLFLEKRESEVTRFPRIVIDEHLVLQRSSSDVPISFFPKKEKNETAASYFLQIQKWKKENEIPCYIFIRPLRNFKNIEPQWSKDFYKPQLIDLNSPFAIVLLQKVLDKHDGKIKIEEILPTMNSIRGKYVREEVVQWKGDKK